MLELTITSLYVHSRVDSNTCRPYPYARVDFNPPEIDLGFDLLSDWGKYCTITIDMEAVNYSHWRLKGLGHERDWNVVEMQGSI
jgi:hypothetical protein